MHTVFEGGPVPGECRVGTTFLHLLHEGRRDDVVGVEGEHPFGVDLVESEVPLADVPVELALDEVDVFVRTGDLDGRVLAIAVNHHDPSCPGQSIEGPIDVGLLIVGEDQWSNSA
jgi:hypothetical protein